MLLPVLISRPGKGRLAGGAGVQCLFGKPQCEAGDFQLCLRVVGRTGGIAKREVVEQQPRHADMFDNISGAAEDDSHDADLLQSVGGKGHRLVADRAIWHQKGDVDCIIKAARDEFGTVYLAGRAVRAIGGQAVEFFCQGADLAILLKPAQGAQGKITPLICGGCMLAVDGDMGNAKIWFRLGRSRVDLKEFCR